MVVKEKESRAATEDVQRPVHRVHRSNVPLKPDKTDPYGWQARGALVRYPHCPLTQIKEGQEDFWGVQRLRGGVLFFFFFFFFLRFLG